MSPRAVAIAAVVATSLTTLGATGAGAANETGHHAPQTTDSPGLCPSDRPVFTHGSCNSKMDAYVYCIQETAAVKANISDSQKKELEIKAQVEVQKLFKVSGNGAGVSRVEKNLIATLSREGHPGAEIEIVKECGHLAQEETPTAKRRKTSTTESKTKPTKLLESTPPTPATPGAPEPAPPANKPGAPEPAPTTNKPAAPATAYPPRKVTGEDVWKTATEYASSDAGRALLESQKRLSEAQQRLISTHRQVRDKYAPTFEISETGSSTNTPSRVEIWLGLVKPDHQGPLVWTRYEIRIAAKQLLFTVINTGKVFYTTPADSPDYGENFLAKVKGSMTDQLEAESARSQ